MTKLCASILTALIGFSTPAAGQIESSFRDDFDQPQLASQWTLVPYSGALPRAHGFNEPGNTYSLTARPGYLRYLLNHMTHEYGFVTGYRTTVPGEMSCCIHDAGLELHRPFTGERWIFETKIDSNLPFTNGRRFETRIYFGDGQPGTHFVSMLRYRDVGPNFYQIAVYRQDGTRMPHIVRLVDSYVNRPASGPDQETGWFRVERNGGALSGSWSGDGTSWTPLFQTDMGAVLDGRPQRLVISGGGWFVLAGHVDWDYVSLQSTGVAPSLSCPLDIVVPADPESCSATVDANVNASGDPAPAVECTVGGSPVTWPHAFPIGTSSVTCTAANGIAPDASCTFDVTVTDDEAPSISAPSPSPTSLWPPNHKMRDVAVAYSASDNCGAAQCVLSVSSNEPVDGGGDGDTSPDWEILDPTRVRLRAERSGTGNGRVYTIAVTCTDSSGNTSTRSGEVIVKHH